MNACAAAVIIIGLLMFGVIMEQDTKLKIAKIQAGDKTEICK